MDNNLVEKLTDEEFQAFIDRDEKIELKKRLKYADVLLYNGEIYSDQTLIDNFPIKYKKTERVAQIKKVLFFLAMVCGISDIRKNLGVYFTLDTFRRAGYGDISGANMHNFLKGLKNCGIIWVVNNHYQFGHKDGSDFSKLYGINACGIINSWKEEFQEYCDSYSYEAPKKTGSRVIEINGQNEKIDLYTEKNKKTVFGKITTVENYTDETIENKIKKFTRNTSQIFAEMRDEYNKGKNKSLQKTMSYKVTLNKITARAYSDYIKTRNITNVEAISRDKWKKDNNIKFSYDIKACVPRVSHLLLTGEWMPSEYDFYQDAADHLDIKINREHIKSLHMHIRFGKTNNGSFNKYIWGNHREIYKEESYMNAVYIRNKYFNTIWDPLYKFCEAFEGKDHSADIFYWESLLEMKVLHSLMQQGITAYNVYDCFYLKKEVDNSFIEEEIEKAAMWVYKLYKDGERYAK